MRTLVPAIALAALGLLACTGEIAGPTADPPEPVSQGLEPLALHAIDWNGARADLGTVSAVVEDDEDLVFFGSRGATLMAGGAIRGVIPGAKSWSYGGIIPAADGLGDWVVGVAANGRIYRVRAGLTLEDVSARYGLSADRVRSVVAIDRKTVAFGLEGNVAIADGANVTRYPGPADGAISGGRGRLAWLGSGGVSVFSADGRRVRTFPIAGATSAMIDGNGRLVVTADRTLYVENSDGTLRVRWTADAPVSAIASAGPRVWMAVGSELAVLMGDALARSSGAAVEPGARLSGTVAGDVWIVGSSVRKVSGSAPSEALADFETSIRPIYVRVCSTCHAPGGSAKSDLSRYEQWVERRRAIEQRVIIDQTMPPRGFELTADERGAIRDWLQRAER